MANGKKVQNIQIRERIGMNEIVEAKADEVVARTPPTLVQELERQIEGVRSALPAHLQDNAQSFVRSLLTECRKNPALAQCDRASLFGGLLTAAQLGFQFGPLGHCYLVPIKGEAVLWLGYAGIIDLAWRSGRLLDICARIVREGDEFFVSFGSEPSLTHRPRHNAAAPITHVYGVAHFVGGGSHFEVMSKDEIDGVMKRSPSARGKSSPWETDYASMAKKTVIKRMRPYLGLSTEVSQAMQQDMSVHSEEKTVYLEEDF
ncbi:MAG: recombinase RecT [Acidimicrobiales bacterium]